MFTVKHRDACGDEHLYTAESIYVSHRGDRFADGIYLDRQPPAAPDEPHTSKHIILFSTPETPTTATGGAGNVWVMNERGATVATYVL